MPKLWLYARILGGHDKMERVLVENGNIEVTEDGRFFRMSTGKECTITPVEIRNGGGRKPITLGVITYTKDGKQRNRYVNRLYAEAFATKPSDKHTLVSARDGNFLNLTKDNIHWISNAERVHKMNDRIYKQKTTCKKCGYRYYDKGKIKSCPPCYKKELDRIEREENKQRKIRDIQEQFRYVNKDKLTVKRQAILDMRLEGKTYAEIGEVVKMTREAVRGNLEVIRKTR